MPADVLRALEQAGLLIEVLREPALPAEEAERDPPEQRWRRLPSFLMLRALTPAPDDAGAGDRGGLYATLYEHQFRSEPERRLAVAVNAPE